jgi:hypothetical protein
MLLNMSPTVCQALGPESWLKQRRAWLQSRRCPSRLSSGTQNALVFRGIPQSLYVNEWMDHGRFLAIIIRHHPVASFDAR